MPRDPAVDRRSADVAARFDGVVSGWIETFRLDGEVTTALKAATVEGAGLHIADVAATATRIRCRRFPPEEPAVGNAQR